MALDTGIDIDINRYIDILLCYKILMASMETHLTKQILYRAVTYTLPLCAVLAQW